MRTSQLRACIVLFVALSALAGLVYPAVVTGIAQVAFADSASGSLVVLGGRVVGTRTAGLAFEGSGWFHGRPSSATLDGAAGAHVSGASNLAASNAALALAVRARRDALEAEGPHPDTPPPMDLLTASASGLDPHISLEAARWQLPRVAAERGLSRERVESLVESLTDRSPADLLGPPRVHLLSLNLALDRAARSTARQGEPKP